VFEKGVKGKDGDELKPNEVSLGNKCVRA